MAINPNNRYPLQTTPPSAAYPYGSSQEITVPGDGTGFPWKDPFIDDIFGLLQGLLERAGIVPSGDPDTAEVSDYIDALGTIMGRKLATTASMLTADLNGALVVQTMGYAAANDGGGAFWYSTGASTPGLAGTAIFVAGLIYDSLGNEFQLLGNSVNPRMFGAVGDGVTDDYIPITSAIDYAGASTNVSTVLVDRGTYKIATGLDLKDKVQLIGEDRNTCVFDFSGAVPGSFPTGYCMFGTGQIIAIPDVLVDLDKGDIAIEFAAAHGRSPDDILVLFDPTTFSLNVSQSHYYAGEMVQIRNVKNATNINATRPLYDDYAAATIDAGVLAPIRTSISGLTVKGIDDATIGVIGVYNGRDCSFADLHLSGTQLVGLEIRRCYNSTLDNIIGRDYGTDSGLNFIVGVSNSQIVRASRLQGGSTRSFLTTGGDTVQYSVPTRELLVTDCHLDETNSSDQSIRLRGNTEHYRIANCTLGGTVISGRYGVHDNCTIYGGPGDVAVDEGVAVLQAETHGADHTFRGCNFVATRNVGSATALVRLSDSSSALRSAGTFRFEDCVFDMGGFTGQVAQLFSRTAAGGAEQSLIVNNCQMVGGGVNNNFDCQQGVIGTGWKRIRVSTCVFNGVGLLVQACEDIEISNCVSRDSLTTAIKVSSIGTALPYTNQVIRIANNHVRRAWSAGIDINNNTGSAVVEAHICGNTSLNNNESDAAVNSNAGIVLQTIADCVLQNNTVGDNRATTKQLRAWYVSACTTVVSNNTLVMQGSTPITELFDSGNTEFHRWNDRSNDEDISRSTGQVGIHGGDPDDASASAKSLVIGDGVGSNGLTVWSGTSSFGKVAFGDTSVNDRCIIQCDHSNSEVDVIVTGVVPMQFSSGAAKPGSNSVFDLGESARRWLSCWCDDLHLDRPRADGGTALISGDVSISATWGTGASVSVTGTDAAGTITVTSGSGSFGSSPTVTITYTDGAWDGGTPSVVIIGVGNNTTSWALSGAQSSTSFQAILSGVTPASTTNYRFNWHAIGQI